MHNEGGKKSHDMQLFMQHYTREFYRGINHPNSRRTVLEPKTCAYLGTLSVLLELPSLLPHHQLTL